MNFDFSKIIMEDFNISIDEKRHEIIQMKGSGIRNYITRHGITSYVKDYLFNKADEIAYKGSKNNDMTFTEKALFAANIAIDNEKFIKILQRGNFTYESLVSYTKLIRYLSNKDINDIKYKKYVDAVNKYTNKLNSYFSKYLGKIDINIIINKINEVMSYDTNELTTKTSKSK